MYLSNRGFDDRQEGHIGRLQHRVKNSSGLRVAALLLDELDADGLRLLVPSSNSFHSRGGRDDEQAKQRGAIVLDPRDISNTETNAMGAVAELSESE